MLEILNKYEDNKWWLSDDLKTIGYYQLNEPFLIVDFSKFHEGIELLLGRPVFTHEFGLFYEQLKKEVEEAFKI